MHKLLGFGLLLALLLMLLEPLLKAIGLLAIIGGVGLILYLLGRAFGILARPKVRRNWPAPSYPSNPGLSRYSQLTSASPPQATRPRPRVGRSVTPKTKKAAPASSTLARTTPPPPDRPTKLDGRKLYPCAELLTILRRAYKCRHFAGACRTMRWAPAQGHIPRGFCGATGTPSQVEVVLVVAEPGDPQPGDHETMEESIEKAVAAYAGGSGLFHKNARRLLNHCFPNMPIEQQLKRVWITESVLCSAVVTTGPVDRAVENACGRDYLLPQLALMPRALVVALGGKAHARLKRLGIPHEQAHALAPPGCNQKAADPSWQRIGELVRSRKR